ncbi:centrosomal protein of 112 kDa-like [Dendronephthya gigantea]|uniref:centrosomal protein of 112 kDa-like n=1 Tax=Dendronephthya gigantea TaxID=151771 RepID=UPI00106C473A|nr:centrosomal protein of 112 kDa-like [Dendronephthya gigantea]XP_028406544.1 centrosomal protein of 112 kDa-like [Dendronephthya gigantea]
MTTSARKRDLKSAREGSAIEKLDDTFNSFVDCMKPFVLKLAKKTERQRIAMWIKKLCEPPGNGASLMSRKNRNMYAQVLLAMLKRDLIEEPFSQQPEPGPLPTMPAYMSIYADDPTVQSSLSEQEADDSDTAPSWIRGELANSSDGSFQDDSQHERAHSRKSYRNHGDENSLVSSYAGSSSLRNHSSGTENGDISHARSPYQARKTLGGKFRYEPVYLREILNSDLGYPTSTPTKAALRMNGEQGGYLSQTRALPSFTTEQEEDLLKRVGKEREVEARTKMAEARFHEDKLKIQQQHDLSVQKILDRKNNELEEVKAKYRSKVTEIETRLKKQDKKIVQQARELESLRQQRDKQRDELKNLAQEKEGTTMQNDFEKKLHDKIAEFEQEKFEMQKKHTQEIQEILDETNGRIAKMESESNQQVEAANGMVKNLEVETQRLSEECEVLRRGRMGLEHEKAELQKQLKSAESECDDLKESVSSYEREKQTLVGNFETNIAQVEKKAKNDVDHEKSEKEKALAKASSTITKLKNDVSELQRKLRNLEQQKQDEIQQLASLHRQERTDLEHNFENKVRSVQDELAQVRRESDGRICDLEAVLREKNAELEKTVAVQRQKEEEAENTLEELKRKMEETSKKIFDDTKTQMDKVEQDLAKSRTSREKQAKEFTRQIENERARNEKLISELKISFEQEKTYLIRENQHEKDLLTREHEREKELYTEKQQSKVQELEAQSRSKSSKDGKVIADLQQVNVSLREELMQKEALYKQQLVELGMLREEEKQTFKRQEESQAAKFRSELEQEKLQLQRQHSTDMEQILDKTNGRFKQMEEDYITRSQKMQETMDALREEIQTLKNERITLQSSQEKRLSTTIRKHEEEKASLKHHHSSIVKSLERDIERQKSVTKEVEKHARNAEIRLQEKISKLQYDYEERMTSLLPIELKEELEDTIRSLRQQISLLQSRADVLQEELDATNTLSSTWDMSRLDKTCE